MKILQVIPYLCFGGAEIMCENLTCALRELGHSVTVVSLLPERTPISQRMERAGIPIRYLDKKLGLDMSMIPKLIRLFREEQPDVVHTHINVLKYAAPAARLAGVKTCVHTMHTLADKEAEGILQKITNQLFFNLGWVTPVALSPQVQRTVASFYHLKESRIPVICNGIDLSRCMPKESYALGDSITIVHAGRFTELKNHRTLLDGFHLLLKEFPQCSLDLLGDGELWEQTREYAETLGIGDRVRFLGSQSNVYPFLNQADVFVLPSRYEGMPMTVIEAMGTGLPIVASNVGGIPDMVTHGQSGLLITPTAEEIARCCGMLLRDDALREWLGRQARQDSVRFSSREMARGYCRVYES